MIKSSIWLGIACAVLSFVGCAEPSSSDLPDQAKKASPPDLPMVESEDDVMYVEKLFVVDHYDPERNAIEDLATTTALAQKSGKRILIEVGGKW